MRTYVILKRPVLYLFIVCCQLRRHTRCVSAASLFLRMFTGLSIPVLAPLPLKGSLDATLHEFQFPGKEFINPSTDYGLYVAKRRSLHFSNGAKNPSLHLISDLHFLFLYLFHMFPSGKWKKCRMIALANYCIKIRISP